MESERDFYQDLYSHLEAREWSDVQIVNLMQKIGRSSLLSCEGVLGLFEYQQAIDEHIEAEKKYDEVFETQPVFTPDAIKEADEAKQRVQRAREAVDDAFGRAWDVTPSYEEEYTD